MKPKEADGQRKKNRMTPCSSQREAMIFGRGRPEYRKTKMLKPAAIWAFFEKGNFWLPSFRSRREQIEQRSEQRRHSRRTSVS